MNPNRTPEERAMIERALKDRSIDDRLSAHDKLFSTIEQDYKDLVHANNETFKVVQDLSTKIDTAAAVAKAVADKGVSSKSFYLTCGGMVIALGGILAGTGHT